jgi:hypothetical protein
MLLSRLDMCVLHLAALSMQYACPAIFYMALLLAKHGPCHGMACYSAQELSFHVTEEATYMECKGLQDTHTPWSG